MERWKHDVDLIFRCDGNSFIGSGHVMRCLSIADAAKKMGEHCLFVTADESFSEIIKSKGYENYVLDSDYRKLIQELDIFLNIIKIFRPKKIFVDSYFVEPVYLNTLWKSAKAIGCRLVYIDDVIKFAYKCDVLVNYNIYGPDKEEDYKKIYKKHGIDLPRLLLGTRYAPLRAEFQKLPLRVIRRQAKHILISTGGADPDHMGIGFAEAILHNFEQLRFFQFHFIIGSMNKDAEKMKKLTVSAPNIALYFNVSDMSALMNEMDIAVSAAGSTLYELCATQTPALTYILADNQILGAEGFSRRGIIYNIGDVRNSSPFDLAGRIISETVELVEDYDRRKAIASKMRNVVDGEGAGRIYKLS